MIQKSPIGPKMAPNGQKHVILIILGPFQIMTVIQLWHHIIQIKWVIQLIQWLSAGSPGAVCPDDVEEAPVRPSWRQIVGSIFKVFVVGYYQKPCVGSILKAGLPSSLPKWGRWGPREAKLTPKFTAFLCVTVLHKPQTRRQNLFLFRLKIFCDVFFLPILVAYDKGKNL